MADPPNWAALTDPARLAALHRLDLLDSPTEEPYDRVVRLTRGLLQVPIALVTLVDSDRQYFLGADGLPEAWAERRQTPLSRSFCKHVVLSGKALLICDARTDAVVSDHLEDLGVTAYLGLPLTLADGTLLGALCAIDYVPRQWTLAEQAAMADLAALTSSELRLRAQMVDAAARLRDEAAARGAVEEQLALKRRLEALGQLTSGVAHDFANVLQTMQAGVRLLETNLDRDPVKARRMIGTMHEVVRRGRSITHRLLNYAQNRTEQAPTPLHVKQILVELQEVLVRTLNQPGLDVQVEAAEDLPPVMVDRGELETALINLATNARDAMPKGGRLCLRARVETDPVRGDGAAYVRIVTEDDGAGMAPETLDRAMQPFFTTKSAANGTGLGLSTAREFAESVGGRLEIASQLGVGTAVSLWLPVAAREDPAA